jgi:uncharacterized membrane protein YbjE (DUF340 family)
MKKTLGFLTMSVIASLLFISCSKDKDDEVVTSNTTMSGSQEVPAVTTSGTGTVNVSYNKTSKVLTYNISWSGLSGAATAMHFHGPALAGVSAGVLIGISGFPAAASGSVSGSFTVPNTGTALEVDLLAGKWYFNIHTAANPTGEIRGQVTF